MSRSQLEALSQSSHREELSTMEELAKEQVTTDIIRASASSTGSASLTVLGPEPNILSSSVCGRDSPPGRPLSAGKTKKHGGTVLGAARKTDPASAGPSGGLMKQSKIARGELMVLASEPLCEKGGGDSPKHLLDGCHDGEFRTKTLEVGEGRGADVAVESSVHKQEDLHASCSEQANSSAATVKAADRSAPLPDEVGAVGYLRYLQRQANARRQAKSDSSESEGSESESESGTSAAESQPERRGFKYQSLNNDQLSEDRNGIADKKHCSEAESEGSSKDDDSDNDDDDDTSDSEDEEERGVKPVPRVDPNTITEESVLAACGIEMSDIESWKPTKDRCAPLELVAEFLRCVMEDKLQAALILCEKVVLMEPSNKTAQEFYPTIMERLHQEYLRRAESSSDDDNDESDNGSSDSDSSDGNEEEEALIPLNDNRQPSDSKYHASCQHSTSHRLQ